jgi:hypothetical protein
MTDPTMVVDEDVSGPGPVGFVVVLESAPTAVVVVVVVVVVVEPPPPPPPPPPSSDEQPASAIAIANVEAQRMAPPAVVDRLIGERSAVERSCGVSMDIGRDGGKRARGRCTAGSGRLRLLPHGP